MTFTSPIWLLAIIPWALIALWLLIARRTGTAVPFLNLWPASAAPTRRALQIPPLGLLTAILAVLLAIVAAAGPSLWLQKSNSQAISIVVDRGLTMSADNFGGKHRFLKVSQTLDSVLSERVSHATIDLTMVPGDAGQKVGGGQWTSLVEAQSGTGVVDPAALSDAIGAALARSSGPVLLVSDQGVKISDPHVIQVAPDGALNNVGITAFTARIDPQPAAMVTILNHSSLSSATLTIRVDGKEISQLIDLPPRGQTRNYFQDLPVAGAILEAEVEARDNPALNHRAWLARQSAWPRIEPRAALPAELQRMIDVYSKRRSPTPESRPIAVVTAVEAVPVDSAAVLVPDAAAQLKPLEKVDVTFSANSAGGGPDFSAIDWHAILPGAQAADSPGGNWSSYVSIGGVPIVAVRLGPPKQIWVGFASPGFARTADFVVFWSKIFDWLSDGGPMYASNIVSPLAGNWRLSQPTGISPPPSDIGLFPGLYQGEGGALRVMNAGVPIFDTALPIPWRPKLKELLDQTTGATYSLAYVPLFIALGLLVVSAATWGIGRSRKTVIPQIQSEARD